MDDSQKYTCPLSTMYFLIFWFPYYTEYQVNCFLGLLQTFCGDLFFILVLYYTLKFHYFMFYIFNVIDYSDISAVFF